MTPPPPSKPASLSVPEAATTGRTDLDRVAEIIDELSKLGISDDALRLAREWLGARRAEQTAQDPDTEYDDDPITVCGQVITFPHYANPHDPKYAPQGRTYRDGQPCNRDCPGEYPCAERNRQREEAKWIAQALRDALYERTGGRGYAEWTCRPSRRRALYGQGERGVWVQILGHDGQVDAETLNASYEWVARHA